MPEVDMPLSPPVSPSAVNGAANGAGSATSILVIDDESGIRESLEVLLTLEGYSVRVVNDGEEGLRVLELENFDLVLLDLALPETPGAPPMVVGSADLPAEELPPALAGSSGTATVASPVSSP